MRVALGADHAGVELKDALRHELEAHGLAYEDFATSVWGEGSWGSTGTILISNSGRFIRVNARDGLVTDLELKNSPSAVVGNPASCQTASISCFCNAAWTARASMSGRLRTRPRHS